MRKQEMLEKNVYSINSHFYNMKARNLKKKYILHKFTLLQYDARSLLKYKT